MARASGRERAKSIEFRHHQSVAPTTRGESLTQARTFAVGPRQSTINIAPVGATPRAETPSGLKGRAEGSFGAGRRMPLPLLFPLRCERRKGRLRRGSDANDRSVESHGASQSPKVGVTERKDPSIGCSFPIAELIAVCVKSRSQANHGLVEEKPHRRTLIEGGAKGVDRSVSHHKPAAIRSTSAVAVVTSSPALKRGGAVTQVKGRVLGAVHLSSTHAISRRGGLPELGEVTRPGSIVSKPQVYALASSPWE
jgi:hypothetical protein